MKKTIVIEPHAGGLGDVLLYSTLPRMFHRINPLEYQVFWSTRVPFRNPEIKQLIKLDPYLSGFLNPDAIDNPDRIMVGGNFFEKNQIIGEVKRWGNPIIAVENLVSGLVHDFPGSEFSTLSHIPWMMHQAYDFPGSEFSTLPVIYYKPRHIPSMIHQVLIDPTSISQGIPKADFEEFVRWVGRWNDVQSDTWNILVSNHRGSSGRDVFPTINQVHATDIFHYIDLIASCKMFLVGESGGQVLAAAIDRSKMPTVESNITALFTTMGFNDKIFTFPNVEYYVAGGITPNYHSYPE